MKIIQEKDLFNFEFWSGAKDLADKLSYQELIEITNSLEDLYPNGLTDTQINDLFWFDSEFICELINKNIEDILDRD
tara:strand:+ start:81 stop:311 length:231 start_codon:yes stop_codon:yes gene_type:complete